MERIDRNGGRAAQTEPRPETMVVFDIHGAAHRVAAERADCRPERRRAEAESGLTPEVIRRWLAGFALALVGLGLLAEPGAAMEPAAAPSVLLESW